MPITTEETYAFKQFIRQNGFDLLGLAGNVSLKKKPIIIDWFKEINAKIEGNSSMPDDEIINRAGSWVTCAVGHQCDVIPRNFLGEPKDILLSTLGVMFAKKIEFKDWKGALVELENIEIRSTILINEINSKNK